jgi:hypothetical protein
MVSRDNKFMQNFTFSSPSGTTVSSRVRYRDLFQVILAQSGDFKNPTPHAYERRKIWYANGVRTTGGITETGPFGEDYGFILDEDGAATTASVYNKALKNLYDQIRSSDLNLTVDVAEWKQLDRMLDKMSKRTIPRLIEYARKAKKKQRRGMTLEEAKNAIGNSWLEYRYGWKPLLSSIYGIVNFERSIASHRKLIGRATSKNRWHVFKAASGLNPPQIYDVTHSRRCEIGITYRVSQPWLFDLTRAVSLNPLAIAWELAPYSFVVDWFIDIGGYMQAMEQAMFFGLTFEKGHVTYTDKVDVKGSLKGSFGTAPVRQIDAPFRTILTRLNRSRLLSPPMPRLPGFEPHLGWTRLASAAALLNQILSPDPKLFRG